jgi:hypothetical protein
MSEHNDNRAYITPDSAARLRARSGDYAPLADVLYRALEQASAGKGAERHATANPFVEQPIMTIARSLRSAGLGFQTGQAIKKTTEAVGMVERGQHAAAERELLGAINYLAAAILFITEARRTTPDSNTALTDQAD